MWHASNLEVDSSLRLREHQQMCYAKGAGKVYVVLHAVIFAFAQLASGVWRHDLSHVLDKQHH